MRKEKDMTTEKRKHLAVWISVIFIFVTLISLFYIVKEENHKCTGEDCPVCACVHQAEQTLKNLSTGMVVVFRPLVVLEAGVLLAAVCFLKLIPRSLVSQKVRLND